MAVIVGSRGRSGGGSSSLAHGYVFLNAIETNVAQFETRSVEFAVAKGDASLVDLTVPALGVIADTGMYAASGYVFDSTGSQAALCPIRFYLRENSPDFAGAENTLRLRDSEPGNALTNFAITSYAEAGDTFLGTINNQAPLPNDFIFSVFLQRIW